MSEDPPTADEIYAIKMAILKSINEEREEAEIQPLVLDSNVSEAADEHCKEMVDNKYSSHWNLAGEKPYQRYFKAGCRDHITQIFGGYDAPENSPFDTTSEAVMKQVFDMHKKSTHASEADDEGSTSSVVDPLHTHIGIGLFVTKDSFRMLEVYLDRYVSIDDSISPTLTDTKVNFQGTMLERDGNWGPYACVVYYDPSPEALSPDDATAKEGYEDFSHHQVAVTWPWEMSFKDGKFSFPIAFEEVREGYYYVQLHVRDNADTIPYSDVQEGLQVPGDGTVVATGFVFHYRGKTLKQGESVGASAKNVSIEDIVTDLRVVTSASQEGKEPDALIEHEHILLGEPIAAASSGLSLYFAKGDREDLDPITDIQYVTGNDENMDGPEGYEVLRVSIATATPERGADKSQKVRAAFEELLRLTENSSGNIANSSVLAYLWENEESRNTLQDAGVDAANVRAALEADPDNTWSIDDYIKGVFYPCARRDHIFMHQTWRCDKRNYQCSFSIW